MVDKRGSFHDRGGWIYPFGALTSNPDQNNGTRQKADAVVLAKDCGFNKIGVIVRFGTLNSSLVRHPNDCSFLSMRKRTKHMKPFESPI